MKYLVRTFSWPTEFDRYYKAFIGKPTKVIERKLLGAGAPLQWETHHFDDKEKAKAAAKGNGWLGYVIPVPDLEDLEEEEVKQIGRM